MMQENTARESVGSILSECQKLTNEIENRIDITQQAIDPVPTNGGRDKIQPNPEGICGQLRFMRNCLRSSLEKLHRLSQEFNAK